MYIIDKRIKQFIYVEPILYLPDRYAYHDQKNKTMLLG